VIQLFLWLIAIGLLAYFFFLILRGRKNKREAKAAGAERKIDAFHVEGLDIGPTKCQVYLFPEKVQINNEFTGQNFEIPITNIYSSVAEQVRKKKAFSLGKAALGEAIAGPLGALYAGSKGGTKSTGKWTLEIGFITKNGEEKKVLFLDQTGFSAINFANSLRRKIGQNRRASDPVVREL
jgi:hypothetical protein